MLYCSRSADHFSGGVRSPNKVCEPMLSTHSEYGPGWIQEWWHPPYPVSSNFTCLCSTEMPIHYNCPPKMPSFLCESLQQIIYSQICFANFLPGFFQPLSGFKLSYSFVSPSTILSCSITSQMLSITFEVDSNVSLVLALLQRVRVVFEARAQILQYETVHIIYLYGTNIS